MHKRKKQNALLVLEAVDNLSLLAELTIQREREKEPKEFIEDQSEEHIEKRSWQDPKNFSLNVEKIRTTFKVLYNYLKDIYDNEEQAFKDLDMQKGIQAMMNLAMEAGGNLDKYMLHFPEGKSMEKVSDWPEYVDLQQFYLNIVAPKVQNRLEIVEKWQEQWGVGAEESDTMLKKIGIQDIEEIRQDRNYELFLIRREDGRPFFNRVLLRHMQLVEQFDELIVHPAEEDPLSKIEIIQDRDYHLTAREILHVSAPYIDEFYRMGMKHKDMELVALMNKAVMALMLTANPRNLLQTTLGKSCRDYFGDFHFFLRTLIASKEFQQFYVKLPPVAERLAHCVINLAHNLAFSFFMRETSTEDMQPLMRQLIAMGAEGQEIASETKSPLSLWNNLLDEDALMRAALKRSPFGPLNNALAVFHREIPWKGFDPISQGNLPYSLFSVSSENINLSFVHLPCPTIQTQINKAEIAPEFDLFVRALSSGKRNQRILLFNLQDRTSWQEYARSTALEELSKKNGMESAIHMVTLATGTDFYFQSGSYRNLNDANHFKKQLKEQVASKEQCGFSFPEEISNQKLNSFMHDAIETIHEIFFAGKKELLHKNRLDFIEIFYLFLILNCIEQLRPDLISFTSKDAIDSSAALNAEIFAFLKMMQSKESWPEEDKDRLRWLFHAPALLIRRRVINSQNLKRATSALEVINAELEAHFSEVTKACSKLFQVPFFADLQIDW